MHISVSKYTCTNSGMVCMPAISPLFIGSLAIMWSAPVQPSTISSMRTPSWKTERNHAPFTRWLVFFSSMCAAGITLVTGVWDINGWKHLFHLIVFDIVIILFFLLFLIIILRKISQTATTTTDKLNYLLLKKVMVQTSYIKQSVLPENSSVWYFTDFQVNNHTSGKQRFECLF